MKKALYFSITALVTASTLMLGATPAIAHGSQVNWSVSVGTPYPPPVVYLQPQPVYLAPQPLFVHPVPIVAYRQPYYATYGGPYYVEPVRYGKLKHKHGKHHHQR